MQTVSFTTNPTKHLLSAFANIAKTRNPVLAVCELLRLQATANNVRISTSCLDVSAYFDTRRHGNDTQEVDILIDPEVLQHFTGTLNTMEIDQELNIRIGGFRYKAYKPDDFPLVPEIPATTPHHIDPAKLARMLKFATKDEMRPAMTGINIGPELCVSDGHRLIVSPGIECAPFVLSNNKILAKLKTATIYPPEKAGEFCAIQSEGFTFNIRTINHEYPKFRAVIPQEQPYFIDIAPQALISALESIAPAANRTTKAVHIDTLPCNMLRIHTCDLDYNKEARIDLRANNHNRPGVGFTFAVDLLLSMLKDAPKGTSLIRIEYKEANRPVTWQIDQDLYLLMPIIRYDYNLEPPGIDKVLPASFKNFAQNGTLEGLGQEDIETLQTVCRGIPATPADILHHRPDPVGQKGNIYITFTNPKYEY